MVSSSAPTWSRSEILHDGCICGRSCSAVVLVPHAGMYSTKSQNKKAVVKYVGPYKTPLVKGDPPAKPYVDVRVPLYMCGDRTKRHLDPWLTTDRECEHVVASRHRQITLIGYIAKNKVRSCCPSLIHCCSDDLVVAVLGDSHACN